MLSELIMSSCIHYLNKILKVLKVCWISASELGHQQREGIGVDARGRLACVRM